MSKTKIILLTIVAAAASTYLWLQPPQASEETIFFGGTILTLEADHPIAEALLIRGNRIISVGDIETVESAVSGTPKTVNLSGKTLMPGLIEPHSHPLATTMLGAAIDVSGFTHNSRTEVIKSLKKGINKGGVNGWVLAAGWDPVMLSDLTAPSLEELDTLSPDLPLVILTQMMHDAYANSTALKAAGITEQSIAPNGGEFVKGANGKLTGTVREIGAIAELFKALPPAPGGAHDFLLAQQYKTYAKAGYTTVGVLGPVGRANDPIATLKNAANYKHSPLRIRIYALPGQINHLAAPESGDTPTPVTGVKFWMDGSPFAGGAAFDKPYENTRLVTDRLHLAAGHIGALNYSPEQFEQLFNKYHQKGFQIAVHAQGERAIDRVLNIAEHTLNHSPRPDHRHRLEHNALITKEQLVRAHKLGFTTSFFIDHLYYYGHALPDLVGERTNRYMPIKTALDIGHKATVHTDNPATPINAFRAMQTLRMRTSRYNNNVLGPDEKLTPEQALEAMTINAAWQLGLERETGSLKAGKSADLLILNHNPLTTPDIDLQDIQVLETWLKGHPVDTRDITANTVTLGVNVFVNMLFGS